MSAAPAPRHEDAASRIVLVYLAFGLAFIGATEFALRHADATVGWRVASRLVFLAISAVLLTVVLPLFLVCAVAGVASVVVRWRRAEPRSHERDQLSWLVLAAVVLAGLLAIAFFTPGAGPGLIAVAMLAVPLALAVAILRRGLWQLDLVLDDIGAVR